MNADELAVLMKDTNKVLGKDFVVVDVRDDDHKGGHIRGAIHSPSSQFSDDVDSLIRKTRGVPVVVFHCMLSQSRGPKAARIFREERDRICSHSAEKVEDKELTEKSEPQQVYVLHDGFKGFQAKYRHDTSLVEDWDRNVWAYIF